MFTRRFQWRPGRSLVLSLVLGCLTHTVAAAGLAERIGTGTPLRVCIWPEYFGVTYRNPHSQRLTGIDIDLAAELGQELGLKLQYVNSSFATLVDDLVNERCEVAMFAVGITESRKQKLRFTQPYLQSDIYGITNKGSRTIKSWADIDKPGVHVGVQVATFMEPVMAAYLKQAKMVVIKPPQTREQELESGRIDVFMTDYPYSRRMLGNAEWAQLVASPMPVHPIPYAYAVKPGNEEWLRALDQFVARIKRDGRLLAAAKKHGLSEIVVLQ